MITGIRSFHYPITDTKRAVDFYTKALGMEFDYEQPGWIALKMSGVQIGLHPEDEVYQVPRDSHGAHGGGCLTLNSNDVSSDRLKLEEHGAKILGEDDAPWGHMLTFEDPDGNVLKLMNPKY